MRNNKNILVPLPMYLLLLVSVNAIILTGHELNKEDPTVWHVISLIAYGFGVMYWVIFTLWFSLDILMDRNGKNW